MSKVAKTVITVKRSIGAGLEDFEDVDEYEIDGEERAHDKVN